MAEKETAEAALAARRAEKLAVKKAEAAAVVQAQAKKAEEEREAEQLRRVERAKEVSQKKAMREEQAAARREKKAAETMRLEAAARTRREEEAAAKEEQESLARLVAAEKQAQEEEEAQRRAEREASEAAERRRVLQAVGLETPERKPAAPRRTTPHTEMLVAKRRLQARRAARPISLPSVSTQEMGLHARCVLRRESLFEQCARELERLQLQTSRPTSQATAVSAQTAGASAAPRRALSSRLLELHVERGAPHGTSTPLPAPPSAQPPSTRVGGGALLAAESRQFALVVALALQASEGGTLGFETVVGMLEELARQEAKANAAVHAAEAEEAMAWRKQEDAANRVYAAMDEGLRSHAEVLKSEWTRACEATRLAIARRKDTVDEVRKKEAVLLACPLPEGADAIQLCERLLAVERDYDGCRLLAAFGRCGDAPCRVLNSLASLPLELAQRLCTWTVSICGALSSADARTALQYAVEHDAPQVIDLLLEQPVADSPPSFLSQLLGAEGYLAAHVGAVEVPSGRVQLAVCGLSRVEGVTNLLMQTGRGVVSCEHLGPADESVRAAVVGSGSVDAPKVPPNALHAEAKLRALLEKRRDVEKQLKRMEEDESDPEKRPEVIKEAISDLEHVTNIRRRREVEIAMLESQIDEERVRPESLASVHVEREGTRLNEAHAVWSVAAKVMASEASVLSSRGPLLQAWRRFRFAMGIALRERSRALSKRVWLPRAQHHARRRAVLARGWIRRMQRRGFHDVAEEGFLRQVMEGWRRLATRPWRLSKSVVRNAAYYLRQPEVEDGEAPLDLLALALRRFALGVALCVRERRNAALRSERLRRRAEPPSVSEDTHPQLFCPISCEFISVPVIGAE